MVASQTVVTTAGIQEKLTIPNNDPKFAPFGGAIVSGQTKITTQKVNAVAGILGYNSYSVYDKNFAVY